MRILNINDVNFEVEFQNLLNRGNMDIENVSKVVQEILNNIKINGLEALLKDIERFDHWNPKNLNDIVITKDDMRNAYDNLDCNLRDSLHLAYDRIYAYHSKQKQNSWFYYESNGIILGTKVTPLRRAGLYIPGGKAAYPSSLLMNAIPALVAGVEEIIVCTPTPYNNINPLLLGAMHICNISKAYKVGGASAIAMMAYGINGDAQAKSVNSEDVSVEQVDVITGPGNIFVACAKKLVFGDVNIDMIAGPSEIGIIATNDANTEYIAIDMLSQAEHDEMASSILITPSLDLAHRVQDEITKLLQGLDRFEVASKSIENRAYIIVTDSIETCVNLMNKIAPEHLELLVNSPLDLLPYIKNAGAIFLGRYTPEPIGDYIAGPNHTLPTGGSARFFSPLSVDNFIKKSSIISFSKQGLMEVGESCIALSNVEGLRSHSKSVEIRLKDIKVGK